MKKSRKPITIIGGGLIIVGILLATIGLFVGANFTIVNTDTGLKAVGNNDRLHEELSLKEFKNIELNIADGDIEVIPSDEYKIEIERMEGTKITHAVENKTLSIKEETNSGFKFVMNFSFNIQETVIKIYVPTDAEFTDITIASKFGDIQLDGLNVNKLHVYSNDGEVAIDNIHSDKIVVENKYGDVKSTNLKTNHLEVEINDGDANLESIVAANTVLNNHYGDTSLSNFTSKGTKIESEDGDININGELLGQTTINSNYGNIYLKLANKESEMSYNIQNKYGGIVVNDNQYVTKATNSVNSPNKMVINSKDGDVEATLK
ncbi:DUF4097 family beta strand repeat-containing protein [Paucisalibacillus sp. EB02]|uniref:DUF4097 family beta strand repeat-containing protein n=1 Tax=Paucisalibacillus sp. EB02 TaxID=1347087 RepID=UPI0004BC8C0A|nr:DUF4097 family beta strand repeat-containing protein [Paucisalibacillus sp. EB02]